MQSAIIPENVCYDKNAETFITLETCLLQAKICFYFSTNKLSHRIECVLFNCFFFFLKIQGWNIIMCGIKLYFDYPITFLINMIMLLF